MSTSEDGSAPPTPFTEILAWAKDQPLWQQDALRTILATNASVPKEAIKRLADLCIAEQGGGDVEVEPLSEDDLPLAGAAAETATLVGFGQPENVNALKNDQWIKVGPQLTIVFGNNASGKTGYARLLKKAFRARIVEDVHPDMRAEKLATSPAAATFEFQKGSTRSKVTWRSNAPLAQDVASRFAVLDAKCGHAYVVNNELQLAPQGLDVLPRLVEALDLVKAELSSRRNALPTVKTFLDGVPPGTAAAATAQRITAATELGDVLPSLEFSEANADRLEAARDELAQLRTPRQAIPQLEAATRAARALQAALQIRQALTSKQAVQELAQLRQAVAAAAEAGEKVESLAADQKLVKGVGAEPWVALIEAAAAFVAENDGEGLVLKQRCPLCLEKLPDPAQARLNRFWSTLNDEAAGLRDAAEAKLAERMAQLAEITKEQDDGLDALLAVVAPHAPMLGLSFNAAMASTATIAKKLKAKKPTEGLDISSALAEVGAVMIATGTKVAALQKGTAGVAAEAQKLNFEIQELEAKKLLSGRTKQIQSYLGALRTANQLDEAHASIKSLAVTHKSADLNERYITDAYRRAVEKELERIGFSRPAPVLMQQASKGKIRILALANPKLKAVAPDQVFSEGERTAIAIASFFSELGLTPSPVGLIFDDPISSLDHRMREKVAERLVDEAARRQVIVFTHDLVFLTELIRFAKDADLPVVTSELQSTSSVVGLVASNPPWDVQDVGSRVTMLEGLLKDAAARDATGHALHHVYGLLRSTWERFIEEKMLNQALERFSGHIEPDSLTGVCFDKSLVKDVVGQINALSALIEAHDRLTLPDATQRLQALRDAMAKHKQLMKA